jgi:hypothetical protein
MRISLNRGASWTQGGLIGYDRGPVSGLVFAPPGILSPATKAKRRQGPRMGHICPVRRPMSDCRPVTAWTSDRLAPAGWKYRTLDMVRTLLSPAFVRVGPAQRFAARRPLETPQRPGATLILAGDEHGGQSHWPAWPGRPSVNRRLEAGLEREFLPPRS